VANKEIPKMRTKLLLAGLTMAVAIPATALAQYDPGCVQNQDNRAAGTVMGAIGGALIGGAIAGRHDRGAGVVIGGVTGAVAGNAIAGANGPQCAPGYYYPGPPPGSGFWGGAPTGVHERIDFMQDRINRSASQGWISPRETDAANRELNFIRSEDSRLHYQDGGELRPEDRDYLQGRLDSLSQRLHWAQNAGY
jgi:hypothetical protein